ncbi:Alpha carbonic anhydrase 1 chloroplastic [Bienertia sinuspersici]
MHKYAVCSSGKRQSPVDINTNEAVLNKTLEPLDRDYHVEKATLLTNGTLIEISFVGKGELKIDGKAYKLKQLHFHTPSEHHLNGVDYVAELHQVHEATDGSRAVVAILFKHGPPSPLVDMLMPQLKELANKPCTGHVQKVDIPKFDLSFLRKWPRDYYRYQGSLTTSPCDENVIWNVLCEAKTISMDQATALSAPLCQENKNNARPVQPLNGRKIQTYDEV